MEVILQVWFWNPWYRIVVWAVAVKLLSDKCKKTLTNEKSTLVQIMVWCRQATRHYLSQCWPRSMSPYGVSRPQQINCFTKTIRHWITNLFTQVPYAKYLIIILVFISKNNQNRIKRSCIKSLLCMKKFLRFDLWLTSSKCIIPVLTLTHFWHNMIIPNKAVHILNYDNIKRSPKSLDKIWSQMAQICIDFNSASLPVH